MRRIVVAVVLGALVAFRAEAEEITLERDEIACRHYSDAVQAKSMMIQNDMEAALKVYARARCPILEKGQLVTIADLRGRYVCLRPKGEPDCFWIAFIPKR